MSFIYVYGIVLPYIKSESLQLLYACSQVKDIIQLMERKGLIRKFSEKLESEHWN